MRNKIIVIVVGLIFLGVGIFTYFNNKRLVKVCTKEAVATVVRYEEKWDDESYMYCPVVEYLAGEKSINKEIGTCSTKREYSIGEKLNILYNPDKIEEFIIKGEKATGFFSYIFMGLGAVVIVAGIVCKFDKQDNVPEQVN